MTCVCVCLQVRRWMRNPKVSVEKAQAKGFLTPCPRCQETQDLWYTHFPTSYACTPYSPGGYYTVHPLSPLCQQKTCKCVICVIESLIFINATLLRLLVRKWKMLSRHHTDGKTKEAEPEGHVVCPWAMSPLLRNPILLECGLCNGPYITYSSEDSWQPRQRTQNRFQNAREHKDWTLEQWKKVMWSESRLTLFQSDGRIRVRREAAEVMHPSCLVPTVQACGAVL
ncbi:hypothetical protein P4O66_022551 [Electrophorus voltai]|uniref:Uncharacterized protein n=1 Tax=Electrophorus voltai TaxID=2609070 RepID=A0AAD8ZN76_9TELE|nr:hypothetical protein P4O66_022551 [Electrophorus voltai]